MLAAEKTGPDPGSPAGAAALRASILNPVRFSRSWLQSAVWAVQAQILYAIARNSRVSVKACHSSGKCLAASERVTLANGQRVLARSLIGSRFQVLTLVDGVPTAVTARAEFNAFEPTFRLRTESGRAVVRNGAHPLFAAEVTTRRANRTLYRLLGWKPLEEIRTGMHVAVADALPAFGSKALTDAEVKVLAYIIGDGGVTGTAATFAQRPGPQLDEMRSCLAEFDARLVATDAVSFRIVGDGRTRRVACASPSGVITHRVNRVNDLLREHGVWGRHSRDKEIPGAVFELPQEQLRTFLSRLYSTDGWASLSRSGTPEIGYCSVSRRLVEQLQHLLLRFGVSGRVVSRPKVHAWVLVVNETAQIVRFCERVGIFGKEAAVDRVYRYSLRALEGRQARRWRYRHAPEGTRWERVVEVEPVGVAATVALEVPEHHTFLTEFWEHNTFVAALAALWWMARHPTGIVITTAPTWVQVERLLWGEIHRAVGRSLLKFPEPNKTSLYHRADNYLLGLSTNQGVRFQGFHGRVLVILDEAPGVNPEIIEAIEGIRAGGDVRTLQLGNPIIPSGPFYDDFHGQRHRTTCITISAFDTPNLSNLRRRPNEPWEVTMDALLRLSEDQLDERVNWHLTTRRWVKEKYEEWGPKHPLFQSKVLGDFPEHAEGQLISLAWVEASSKRDVLVDGGELEAGLDVAGPGEAETVLTIINRRTGAVVLQRWWTVSDPRGEVVAELRPFRDRGQLGEVKVDSNGIGWGMACHLRDLGFKVRFVNVGQASTQPDRFKNLRAEFFWQLAMRFKDGEVAGLKNEKTQGQLTSILYEHDARGRVVIEAKEDAAKRGVPSPDRADSLMLAFARPPVGWQVVGDIEDDERREKGMKKSPDQKQLEAAIPEAFAERPAKKGAWQPLCGNCIYRDLDLIDDGRTSCTLRRIRIRLSDPGCAHHDPGVITERKGDKS